LGLGPTLERPAILYGAHSIFLSLISFVAWSNSNSDANMQFFNNLEFFELLFNSLVAFVKKNCWSCWDFTYVKVSPQAS